VGCRPIDALDALRRHGLVPRASWPLHTTDPELLALGRDRAGNPVPWINTKPPFDLYHEGADATMTGYFRADTGPIVDLLETALDQQQIPVFGMFMEGNYEDVRGREIYDVPTTEPDGEATSSSHMQAICGYDEDSFEIVSSWGEDHGDSGIVRVRKSILASPWCFARMVITSAPKALAV
jgi:hypothetical protein